MDLSLLLEAPLEVAASVITRKVFDALKHNIDVYHKSGELEIPVYPNDRSLIDAVVLKIQYKPGTRRWPYVKGNFVTKGKHRVIFIEIPSVKHEILPQDYQALYQEIDEIIRHELEHSGQHKAGTLSLKVPSINFNDPDEVIWYFTHPDELAARVAATYYDAKKKGVPFTQAVKEKMNDLKAALTRREINGQEIDRVISSITPVWHKYAVKRFPRLQ
jgi:hypothetical protein